jgi:hypothetical protein
MATMRPATAWMRSRVATEEPPNFKTSVAKARSVRL